MCWYLTQQRLGFDLTAEEVRVVKPEAWEVAVRPRFSFLQSWKLRIDARCHGYFGPRTPKTVKIGKLSKNIWPSPYLSVKISDFKNDSNKFDLQRVPPIRMKVREKFSDIIGLEGPENRVPRELINRMVRFQLGERLKCS